MHWLSMHGKGPRAPPSSGEPAYRVRATKKFVGSRLAAGAVDGRVEPPGVLRRGAAQAPRARAPAQRAAALDVILCAAALCATALCATACDARRPGAVTEHDASGSSAAVARPARATECPVFHSPTRVGAVSFRELDEASGLVSSRQRPGVLWAHNDSGDEPRLFALDEKGHLLAVYALPSVVATDWEDMAVGPGKETQAPHLYIGDLGDNRRRRDMGVLVHRVPEPTLPAAATEAEKAPARGRLGPLETFRLRYPDGPHDAETLLVDPRSGELVLLTKALFEAPQVFHTPALKKTSVVLEGGAKLDLEAAGIPALLPTAGDVSPDGRWVIVRSYDAAYLWLRNPKEPLHRAFGTKACKVPLAREPQGETVAFAADGQSYFTLSEGVKQPLFQSRLEP